MKFSGRLPIPFILVLFFYILACGRGSDQSDPLPADNYSVKNSSPTNSPGANNNHQNDSASGLYANDFGPEKIDEKIIPSGIKNGYTLFKAKCAKCHTLARPLNAQYIEADEVFRSRLLKLNPKALDNPALLKLESDIWKRMVKRMMAKPGNNILLSEGKEIHGFLVWLYLNRVGASGELSGNWINHRKKLLEEFKKKYPERYKELYGK